MIGLSRSFGFDRSETMGARRMTVKDMASPMSKPLRVMDAQRLEFPPDNSLTSGVAQYVSPRYPGDPEATLNSSARVSQSLGGEIILMSRV